MTSATNIPKLLRLHYVDFPFWRGECIRIAFLIGDIPFEDRRVSMKTLKEEAKSPFGGYPILEAGDDESDLKILGQTQAIAVYAGKLAGIHPDDPWLAAKVDECINGCTDVTEVFVKTYSIKDPKEKIEARQKLIDSETGGRLWLQLNGFDKIVAKNNSPHGFVVGNSLTVADLALWRLIMWMDSGTMDGVPKNWASDTFPDLAKLFAAVDAEPKVQEYKKKYAKYYDKPHM